MNKKSFLLILALFSFGSVAANVFLSANSLSGYANVEGNEIDFYKLHEGYSITSAPRNFFSGIQITTEKEIDFEEKKVKLQVKHNQIELYPPVYISLDSYVQNNFKKLELMKKSKQLLLLFFIACSLQIFAQHNEKVITNPHKGEQTILTKFNNSVPAISQIFQKKDSPELIWEYTEASSICRSAHISDETYDTFIGWHVNNYRWAYHKETNIPVWEYSPASSSEDLIWHNITPDGTRIVACNNHSIYLFDTISAVR